MRITARQKKPYCYKILLTTNEHSMHIKMKQSDTNDGSQINIQYNYIYQLFFSY